MKQFFSRIYRENLKKQINKRLKEKVLSQFLSGVADIETFEIDFDNQSIEIFLFLRGEKEKLHIIIHYFALKTEAEQFYLILSDFYTNREWLTALLNKKEEGLSLPLPQKTATVLGRYVPHFKDYKHVDFIAQEEERLLREIKENETRAKKVLADKEGLKKLLEKINKKLRLKDRVFSEGFGYFRLLYLMLRDMISGRYKSFPFQSLVLVVSVLIYFINPFDLLPDFFAVFGFSDDISAVFFVLKSIRSDLEAYLKWRTGSEKAISLEGWLRQEASFTELPNEAGGKK